MLCLQALNENGNNDSGVSRPRNRADPICLHENAMRFGIKAFRQFLMLRDGNRERDAPRDADADQSCHAQSVDGLEIRQPEHHRRCDEFGQHQRDNDEADPSLMIKGEFNKILSVDTVK